MKFRVLGCYGGEGQGFHLTSFLIEDRYLLDAGGASSSLTLEEQTQIDHILVSHTHLDHCCGIAFIADNVLGRRETPLSVHSIPFVITNLKEHLLNNIIWPDFTKIPTPQAPILTLRVMAEGSSYSLEDFVFTPIAVNHSVPAVGYLVKGGEGSLIYTGDTGPTQKIWKVAASLKGLKAIITEVSFPNRLQKIADLSGHLTPKTLAGEIRKAGNPLPPIFITHLKPQFLEEIEKELRSCCKAPIQVLEQGKTYHF